jgi:hypothetical protein
VACAKNSCQRRRKRSTLATSAFEGDVPRHQQDERLLEDFRRGCHCGNARPSVAMMSLTVKFWRVPRKQCRWLVRLRRSCRPVTLSTKNIVQSVRVAKAHEVLVTACCRIGRGCRLKVPRTEALDRLPSITEASELKKSSSEHRLDREAWCCPGRPYREIAPKPASDAASCPMMFTVEFVSAKTVSGSSGTLPLVHGQKALQPPTAA